MPKGKKDPCVLVCRYRGPNGWCVACGLTALESRRWWKMKPYEQTKLLKELEQRLTKK